MQTGSIPEGRTFDLLVVGGGVNGVGIARDAAGRGLSVLLVEQSDLASATSSASTKLIHGGLRYLEEASKRLPLHPIECFEQVDLVFESVTERWRMSRLVTWRPTAPLFSRSTADRAEAESR